MRQRAGASHPQPTDAQLKENGALDIHAGYEETSLMIFLRPDLVSPIYRQLAPLTVNQPGERFSIARAEG